ncbi:MAG: preprotein translocase subunit SecE [Clostridia bacterium]
MSENKTNAKKADGKKPNPFTSFFKRITKFFKDCKGELKKIVWPTKETVFKNTGVVLVTIIILGVFIFLLDTVFMQLLGLVMDTAA